MSVADDVKDWPIAHCAVCKRPFGKSLPRTSTCPACFKAAKGYKLLAGDMAFVRLQIELTAYIRWVRRLRDELQQENAKQRAPEGITREQVMALIKLCHPDKHGNSDASTEATKWLLELRAKTR